MGITHPSLNKFPSGWERTEYLISSSEKKKHKNGKSKRAESDCSFYIYSNKTNMYVCMYIYKIRALREVLVEMVFVSPKAVECKQVFVFVHLYNSNYFYYRCKKDPFYCVCMYVLLLSNVQHPKHKVLLDHWVFFILNLLGPFRVDIKRCNNYNSKYLPP